MHLLISPKTFNNINRVTLKKKLEKEIGGESTLLALAIGNMLSYSTIKINNGTDSSLTLLQTNMVLQGLVLFDTATSDATEKSYYGGTKIHIHMSDMTKFRMYWYGNKLVIRVNMAI
jgi:hypothetical protein